MRKYIHITLSVVLMAYLLVSCGKDTPIDPRDEPINLSHIPYDPTPREITIPDHFPPLNIPTDNPLTEEGIELGRHLFYDPILSIDSTIACASCHLSEFGFSDPNPLSFGVDGTLGKRQAMPLLNVAYFKNGLFWDGRSHNLEHLSGIPVEDPLEMKNTWETVVSRLTIHTDYPVMYRKAFGIITNEDINKDLSVKAISQFLRIMVSSGKAKYDQVQAGKDVFTDQELIGHDLFFDVNADLPDAECGHCHNVPLGSSDDFFNNGITPSATLTDFPDLGFGKVTESVADNGKFRAPSLRNIIYTAPYMHNGKFSSLDEVIDHYNSGGHFSPNRDPLILNLGLSEEQKEALKAFILTMTEPDFNDRPELQNPFK